MENWLRFKRIVVAVDFSKTLNSHSLHVSFRALVGRALFVNQFELALIVAVGQASLAIVFWLILKLQNKYNCTQIMFRQQLFHFENIIAIFFTVRQRSCYFRIVVMLIDFLGIFQRFFFGV